MKRKTVKPYPLVIPSQMMAHLGTPILGVQIETCWGMDGPALVITPIQKPGAKPVLPPRARRKKVAHQ